MAAMAGIKLEHLPQEVLVHILKKLDLPDIRNVMLTNKFFLELLIANNTIWKSLCSDRLVVRNSMDNRKPISFSCYNQYRISNNWCKGVYRNKVVIHHHTNYMPWLILYNSEVLFLSIGSELRCFPTDRKGYPFCKETLWKLDVPKVKRNDIRTNDVSRFIVKDSLLACGNRDGSAAVYKFDRLRQKPRLLHHIKDCHENGMVEVSAVELITDAEKYCLITGSMYSSNLNFWYSGIDETNSSDDVSCHWASSMSLPDEVGVRCLSLNNAKDKLAIGLNGNSKPLLLDMNTEELVNTDVNMNANQIIRDIRWHDENTILYVTHCAKLQLLDVRTHNVVYNVLDPFISTFYCVKSDGDRAVLAGTAEYSRCVLFDVRNHGCHKQIYFTQKKSSPVYSLDFDSTKLIAAADRSVAVLNFNIKTSSAPRKDYSQRFEYIR